VLGNIITTVLLSLSPKVVKSKRFLVAVKLFVPFYLFSRWWDTYPIKTAIKIIP